MLYIDIDIGSSSFGLLGTWYIAWLVVVCTINVGLGFSAFDLFGV